MNWNILNKEAQVEYIKQASFAKPQIIFKHSTTCPLSSMAKRRLDAGMENLEYADVYYFDILANRSLSNYIAEELGVHHESPQVIVVNGGETTYDESHLDIQVEDLVEHQEFIQK